MVSKEIALTRPTATEATLSKGKRRGGRAAGRKKKAARPTLAETLDRHVLYEHAVQCVEAEIDFVDDTFKQRRGRLPKLVREDFCGTANTSCEFVRRRAGNRAIGVDLDDETLRWCREHNFPELSAAQRERVTLLHEDVRTVDTEPVDALLAMNFSYFIFASRDELRAYFERARAALKSDGLLFLDCYGGSESYDETEDEREIETEDEEIGTFTYIWDQHVYHPVTGYMECRIHFAFPDGSRMDDAFVYEWRMWTLPEIRELLVEAGFSDVTVYWEGTDEEDEEEGNGVFEPTKTGDADPAWVSYIVAAP